MLKSSGGVVLILGGVALVYLGATGYLASAWNGLRGQCAGGGVVGETSTTNPTGQAGDAHGGRALGRGTGGQVSTIPVVDRGGYYPGPTGALMASDAGVW